MHHTSTITINTPCTVGKDQITSITNGSYCHVCEKQVVDYTAMSDRELIRSLRQNPTGCGSFRHNQLDRPLVHNELVRRG